MAEKKKILITVKTYPVPSENHLELVCTAGVEENGSWVRLYPVDFRYMEQFRQYKKYQWVEVEVEKNPKDPRPESYRPDLDTLKPVGKKLDTRNCWAARKKYVLARGVDTMCGLEALARGDRSLGIVRPLVVEDLVVERTEREWPAKYRQQFDQTRMFGPKRKPLEKIPYKFSYRYGCEEPGCTGHKMMIEDWEVGELYRRMRDKFGDEDAACDKVKETFLDRICAEDVDTHFFVGTTLAHGSWIILGAFWPKKLDS